MEAVHAGDGDALSMVKRIYVGYPETLHTAAAQSVTSHLKKLERDGLVRRAGEEASGTIWEATGPSTHG